MIRIIGKVNTFIKRKTISKGGNLIDIVEASTSVEKTDENGKTIDRQYYEVIFSKENFPKEKLLKLKEDTCYVFDVVDGWVTFRSYTSQDETTTIRVPQIFIKDAKLVSATPVSEKAKKAREARKAERAEDSPLPAKKSEELPF